MFNISQCEQKFALLESVNIPVECCTDGDISSESFNYQGHLSTDAMF